MKILHVGISEHLGGIETYLYKIAANIDLQKYSFDFLTYPGVTPCFYEEFSAMGCRFPRVTSRRESLLKFRKEFTALLKREQYDIVHCHLVTYSFIEPIKIALKNGAKVVVHSHSGSYLGSRRSKALHYVNRAFVPYKKITKLAVSQEAATWLFGKQAGTVVLNNGVDLRRFVYSAPERTRVRQELGVGDERLFVHVGRFTEAKNHGFLIDVFHELVKMEPTAKLMLVGEGSLKASIEEKVAALGLQNNVIFTGIRKDIASVLSAGDVFVFPSFYEGFPCSLIEAEATGLYCFAADTITKEAQIDGLCRYLSLDLGAKAWAEQLHAYEGKVERASCGEKIRAAKLDVESDMERLQEIYERAGKKDKE